MNAYHCDAEGCDSWQRTTTDNPVFHILCSPGDDDEDEDEEHHFCSLNCCMSWAAAHSTPNEAHEHR